MARTAALVPGTAERNGDMVVVAVMMSFFGQSVHSPPARTLFTKRN